MAGRARASSWATVGGVDLVLAGVGDRRSYGALPDCLALSPPLPCSPPSACLCFCSQRQDFAQGPALGRGHGSPLCLRHRELASRGFVGLAT